MASDPRIPRRAPEPEERRRDAERSRQALLHAAMVEFAAKGRAGARVSEIAARAGVNKQLISYYFGGKDGLYAALVERWLAEEEEFADPALPLDELVQRYLQAAVSNGEMTRLFLREGLDGPVPAPADEPTARAVADEVADLRRRQQLGEIAEDLDPAFVLLMLQALACVGVQFADDVRRLTGMDPASPQFTERYGEQLRRVVRRLALPDES